MTYTKKYLDTYSCNLNGKSIKFRTGISVFPYDEDDPNGNYEVVFSTERITWFYTVIDFQLV